jgi:hypothetical protein
MSTNTNAINLLQLITTSASAQRINTVDRALAGSGIGQKNFKGKWLGYKLDNRPTARVNGIDYTINTTSFSGASYGTKISVRAGKDTLIGAWR